MLPTVDLSNFIKRAVMAVGWVFINPIPRTIALATSIMGLWVTLVGLFDFIPRPQISISSMSFNSPMVEYIFYIGSLDTAFAIVNGYLGAFYWAMNALASLTVGMVVAMWTFRSSELIGRAYARLLQ